jgi:predicted outer membrane protein
MKPAFYLLFVLTVMASPTAHGQSQELPTGVQLTPAFQVPPIAINNFNLKFPGIKAEWKPLGENYAAVYRHNDHNATNVTVYDRNGNFLQNNEQLKKGGYPKTIDQFFTSYYPDEKYEVWRRSDSAGAREYFSPYDDTLWFDGTGRYVWQRNRSSFTISETDLELLTRTASAQLLDVSLAQLAAINASSPEVKNAASKRVANDFALHSRLNEIATRKHVHLPTELNQQQQKKLAEFGQLQGEAFDKAYTRLLVKEDRKNSSRLNRALRYIEDPELREWTSSVKRLSDENAQLSKQAYCHIRR